MAIAYDDIERFLEKWETRQLRGYIPCDPHNYRGGDSKGFKPIGQSGVTIATGLDLGQQGPEDLTRYGITGELAEKLSPYLSKTKYSAIEALRERPLTISDEECDRINSGVHRDYITRARRKYESFSRLRFPNIPAQAQAVIVSLFYQLGYPKDYHRVWIELSVGDWAGAAKTLREDSSRYKLRRWDEAELLESIE